MLNPGQRFELEYPFKFNEHGFVPQYDGDPGGNPYIQKNAIRRRLDKVTPGWCLSEPCYVGMVDDVISMTQTLTIDGESRGALGTGIVQRYKKNGELKPMFEISREVVKAQKAAASDCFPRAAWFFGVGWYMRGIPTSWKDRIKTREGLEAYLKAVADAMDAAKGDPERAKELLGNGGAERRIR